MKPSTADDIEGNPPLASSQLNVRAMWGWSPEQDYSGNSPATPPLHLVSIMPTSFRPVDLKYCNDHQRLRQLARPPLYLNCCLDDIKHSWKWNDAARNSMRATVAIEFLQETMNEPRRQLKRGRY